jgi:hypothetical protein
MARPEPATLDEFVRRYPVRKLECGCLVWRGCIAGRNYGRLRINGKSHWAHRYAWSLVHGPIPAGVVLTRRVEICDEPQCVNPEHMQKATRQTVPKLNARRGLVATGIGHAVRVAIGRRKTSKKLTIEKAREIRARRGEPANALAAEFGIDRSLVYLIWRNKSWAEATPMMGLAR